MNSNSKTKQNGTVWRHLVSASFLVNKNYSFKLNIYFSFGHLFCMLAIKNTQFTSK